MMKKRLNIYIDYNNECNNICKCKALNILIKELQYYQKYNKNEIDMDIILKYFTLNKQKNLSY